MTKMLASPQRGMLNKLERQKSNRLCLNLIETGYYINMNNRYLNYFYTFKSSDGHVHYGVNRYDTVLHWITYVDDYKFQPEELKTW